MADQSRSVIEALDRIRFEMQAIFGGTTGYEYPKIANGPVEQVLAFNNNETIKLVGPDEAPHFSSHGVLTDLQHRELPGTRVETTFPVDPATLPEAFLWPPVQKKPWDGPPVKEGNTTGNGYSKQAYFFDNDKSSLVTVGPSLPKIQPLKNGGAQFWVGSIGVVSQGTGRFAGARGTSVYVGSGYFEVFPEDPKERIKLLRNDFTALVGTYFKVVLKKDQAG